MFTGFSQGSTDFLWGIRLNNYREWFLENKSAYTEHIQKPLGELARDVWACMTQKHKLDVGYHVSRIYRDARRIRSGGPYKEHLWFSLEKSHDNWQATPVFFFEISCEGYMYGMGSYATPPAVMKRFRDRLDANPAEFIRLAKRIKKEKDFKISGEEYRRKKGEKGGMLDDWYNRKSLSVIAEYKGHEAIYSPEFTATLCSELKKLVPLYNYLWYVYGNEQ